MSADNLKETVVRAAELLDLFKRQSEEAGRANRDSARRLQKVIADTPQQVRQAADGAFERLSGDVSRAVKSGVEQPLGELQRAASESRERIDAANQGFSQLTQRLATLERHLLTIVLVAGVALLLALAAGGGLLWYLKGEVRNSMIEADLLRAYNRADVVLCQDGRLCARVEAGAAGEGDEYRLVAPRR